MLSHYHDSYFLLRLWVLILGLAISSCASDMTKLQTTPSGKAPMYLIGPGDGVQIFVWGNTELSITVPVRPDGRITTPLVEDVMASGKTPSQLAREIEERLGRYIRKPVVTVMVTDFVGRSSEQIRVIGEVTTPQTIPYKEDLTLLDVVISVGGLTEFASGNGASIARVTSEGIKRIPVRLDDLIKDGNISANIAMEPGDVLFVPESWF